MKIQIKKIKELKDALHPNNIEIGFKIESEMDEKWFRAPTVGERFWVSLSWSTSAVQRIIDEKTFETYNSVYEWEALK